MKKIVIICMLIFCIALVTGCGENGKGNVQTNSDLKTDNSNSSDIEDNDINSEKSENGELTTDEANNSNLKKSTIILEVEEEVFSEKDINETVYKIQQRVNMYNVQASVSRDGDNKVKVELFLKNDELDKESSILDNLYMQGALELIDMDNNVIITDTYVKDAQPYTIDSSGNTQYMVVITFTDEGAKLFADETEKIAAQTNVSKRYIQIVYDGVELGKPACTQRIEGGQVPIDDIESIEAAKQFASIIKIGSLPLKLNLISHGVINAN